jgi:hypothetical protein
MVPRVLLSNELPLKNRVEVVEIVDVENPVLLFGLPGERPRGVVAKKTFNKGDAILCYGGRVIDDLDTVNVYDQYIFDCDLEDLGYTGPQLFIDGANSVAGAINDPMAFGGGMIREENCVAYH